MRGVHVEPTDTGSYRIAPDDPPGIPVIVGGEELGRVRTVGTWLPHSFSLQDGRVVHLRVCAYKREDGALGLVAGYYAASEFMPAELAEGRGATL